MKQSLSNRIAHGFTLIELMVVIVIIGVLAALIVPKVMSRPDEARIVAAKQDIATLMQALKLYRLDRKKYPTNEEGLAALLPNKGSLERTQRSEGYVERLPADPWGSPYQYLNPGLHSEIDVFSLGADSQPGGDGANADVGNWDL